MSLSGGFVHSMALDIGFPFRAFELIIDTAGCMGTSHLNIFPIKSKDDFDLLSFEY